jgi:hypothetical protein
MSFTYSNVENKSPCHQGCPDRTSRCKFDGTCDKYAKWNVIHQQQKEEQYKRSKTEHDLKFAYDARQKRRPLRGSSDALGKK